MSSRRVNVPAKRSTGAAESAAGILNEDNVLHVAVSIALRRQQHMPFLVSGTTTTRRDGTLIPQHIPFLGSGMRDRHLSNSGPET